MGRGSNMLELAELCGGIVLSTRIVFMEFKTMVLIRTGKCNLLMIQACVLDVMSSLKRLLRKRLEDGFKTKREHRKRVRGSWLSYAARFCFLHRLFACSKGLLSRLSKISCLKLSMVVCHSRQNCYNISKLSALCFLLPGIV